MKRKGWTDETETAPETGAKLRTVDLSGLVSSLAYRRASVEEKARMVEEAERAAG